MSNFYPPGGRPWALFALCGASLLLNIFFLAGPSPAVDCPPVSEVEAVAVPPSIPTEVVTTPQEVPAPVEALPSQTPVDGVHDVSGFTVVRASVQNSLPYTFKQANTPNSDRVAAVYARLFFWDLDLRRDLQKGDDVSVAFREVGELPEITAATYRSAKLGTSLTAFRYHASSDAFPSYWDADGNEVPKRLVNGPLAEYQQVTALLKDRTGHKGMDFKTPVGTTVKAPKAALVTRVNWNFKYNGNCLELQFADGVKVRMLHLSRTDVKAGQRIAAGAIVGLTGNTGRSTAPHLHYEMDRGGKILDPVDYHGVTRRSLQSSDAENFATQVTRLSLILEGQETGSTDAHL
jgi:murein DD-endopeptidase